MSSNFNFNFNFNGCGDAGFGYLGVLMMYDIGFVRLEKLKQLKSTHSIKGSR